jgi:hypothetical protein
VEVVGRLRALSPKYRAGEGIRTLDVNLDKTSWGLSDQWLRAVESVRDGAALSTSVVGIGGEYFEHFRLSFLSRHACPSATIPVSGFSVTFATLATG